MEQLITVTEARQMYKSGSKTDAGNEGFLVLKNINKIYPNKVQAVYDFNLAVRRNEFIVLVGPSGCGKSTTLRMIAGLEEITSGYLYIDGVTANYLASKDRDIAMVFQNYALYPNMTVFENIAFSLEMKKTEDVRRDKSGNVVTDSVGNPIKIMRNYTKEEIRKKVFEVAEILDLGAYLDRKPKELSGGQMQRVALGRAIVKNVPLFLMDEPLSNLDARLRLTMRSEIVKLHKRINATTIYVTHDQTEAMTMADRIVVMSKGFVQQIDTPEQIYNNPCNLFVAKFVGTPPINLFTAKFDGTRLVSGDRELPLSADTAAAINAFYDRTYKTFAEQLDAYDGSDKSKEFILKVLSATADKVGVEVKIKRTLRQKISGLFGKKQTEQAVDGTLDKLKEKTELLQAYCRGDKTLTVGIRPEALNVELYDKATHGDDCMVTQPTLIELMGSEIYVHFDLQGEEMIAKMSAKTKINEQTKLAIKFNAEDIYLFDPISGERICR